MKFILASLTCLFLVAPVNAHAQATSQRLTIQITAVYDTPYNTALLGNVNGVLSVAIINKTNGAFSDTAVACRTMALNYLMVAKYPLAAGQTPPNQFLTIMGTATHSSNAYTFDNADPYLQCDYQ